MNTIHESYKVELEKAVDRAHVYNKKLSPRLDCWLFESKKGDVTLQFLVNQESQLICDAAFQGADTRTDAGLLTRFCELTHGMTPQEAADHGAILLEYRLRDRNAKRQVPGILTPKNADPIFELCSTLARDLLKKYNEMTGNRSSENFFDYDCTLSWLQKTDEQKIQFIHDIVAAHQEEVGMPLESITFKSIEADCKVCVEFPKTATLRQQQLFLFRAEKLLRDIAEPTLQLYAEERPDANKIRQ